MAHAKLNIPAADPFEEKSEMPIQALFPDIFRVSDLKIDESLPLIKIISSDKSILPDKVFRVSGECLKSLIINLPRGIKNADIFLLINKKKKDMFYQVPPGEYQFKEIKLNKGENVIELFYRQSERRSLSSYLVIQRS